MAKIGINTFLWTTVWNENTFRILENITKLGFDVVQIPILDLDAFDAEGISKALQHLGLDCYISAGLKDNMDVTSNDRQTRLRGVEYLRNCVRLANQMGSPFLSGSFHSVFGKKALEPVSNLEWEHSAECLRLVAQEARQHGMDLVLEPINRYESFLVNTAEQAKRLIGMIGEPNIKIQLDTFHMNLEEENQAETIRACGKDLTHFHVAENHRGRFGRGTIPWDEIFVALCDINYQGAIVIETFVPEVRDVALAAAIWRQMASSADALAQEGLVFIRDLVNRYKL